MPWQAAGPGQSLVGVQGAKPLEAPKNLHLTLPKTGPKMDQNTWMVMHFFYVHCSTKSQENSKRSKSFIS